MPIYEYRCNDCGHELEKLQRMNDDSLVDCPVCEAPALKRLISAASFRLKGSGWYETDFKKGDKRNLADSSPNSSSESSNNGKKSDGGGKSESKSSSESKTSSDKKTAKPAASTGA